MEVSNLSQSIQLEDSYLVHVIELLLYGTWWLLKFKEPSNAIKIKYVQSMFMEIIFSREEKAQLMVAVF